MSLFFGDVLKFLQNLADVCHSRIRNLILEIKVDSVSSWDRYSVFSLIILNKLPESIGTERFLETEGHDLIFTNLCPLDTI